MKCPGKDRRSWTPDDIVDVPCPGCGAGVEFFRDDVWRECVECGRMVRRPGATAACDQWCAGAWGCSGAPREPAG